MSSLITSEQNDIERIAFLVNECKKMNIQVLAPNINESFANFAKTNERIIRFGLKAIKNVGQNIAEIITKERILNNKFQSIADFIERTSDKDLNKKSLESLIKCGALDDFGDRKELFASVEKMLSFAREIQKAKQNCQESLFSSQQTEITPSFKLTISETINQSEADKKTKLGWEKELLGLYISEHPLNHFQDKLNKITISCKDLSQNQVGQRVTIGGLVNSIKKIITKTGQPMLFVEIEDISGRIEAIVFPSVLQKTVSVWQEENVILISGKLNDRDGNLKILCDNAKILE